MELEQIASSDQETGPFQKIIHLQKLNPKFITQIEHEGKKKLATKFYRSKRNSSRMRTKKNTKGLDPNTITIDNFKFTSKVIPFTHEEQEILNEQRYEIDGDIVHASWRNGKMHGNCRIVYKSGHEFEGKYEYGIRIQGKIRFSDGTQYVGKFMNNEFHGQSVIQDPFKRKIYICWNNGVPAKKGRIQYQSGDIYIGEIEDLKKHGQGYIFFKNGAKFVGNFYKGIIEGPGVYYLSQQDKVQGVWKNGVLEINAEIHNPIDQAIITLSTKGLIYDNI